MNQKKTAREKTKFSKLRLHSSSTKSYKLCSPRPQEKISSYFSSALNNTESTSNETEPSQAEYISDDESNVIIKLRSSKSVPSITSSKSCSDIDTTDFTKPKLINIKAKLKNKCSRSENITKRSTQNVSKAKVHHSDGDTNQEHLQLAIAMSKSIMDVENLQETECEDNTFPSTQQKIMKVKRTLDQFGFGPARGSVQVSSKSNAKVTKGKKFKYCTPTLFLRTETDRTKIIENKVSQIINNISIFNNATQETNVYISNEIDKKPKSFMLRDYYQENSRLFNINSSCCAKETEENRFYSNGIVEPANDTRLVGVLLKDWSAIPGRESTPPTSPNKLETKSTPEISMSPELFADSDEDATPITMEDNEKHHCSRKEFINSAHIDIENFLESDGSTKSISLLDANINKNASVHVPRTGSLSLSPFPTLENHLNNNNNNKATKPKPKYNIQENSDSLSPFEPAHVYVETKKSPKRKVTPKKKTPKSRKVRVVSFGNPKTKANTPCKRSILFTDKQVDEKMQADANRSSEICHIESFCNDSIQCFDLTHSSDDEVLNLDSNKSFTITQLINELSPKKCETNNDENEATVDPQPGTESTNMKIISRCVEPDLSEEFSPEFDCLDVSNNKIFYETLNNSLVFKNDDEIVGNKNKICENKNSLNENVVLSQSSINSTCSDISDEELNYSCNSMYRRYDLSDRVTSISDDAAATDTETETTAKYDLNQSTTTRIQHPRLLELSTPVKVLDETDSSSKAPKTPKTEIVINREYITPKGHYSEMDTPEINRHLDKYGLKSMKRNKGVKILQYLYDSTHPYENDSNDAKIVSSSSDEETGKAMKRRKTKNNGIYNEQVSVVCSEPNGIQIADSETVEDIIFERTQSNKLSSCRLPLHLAWYNLLTNSKELQETILTYTPIQVEEIYKQLKKLGYKFHMQDIIAFLDKKCITIKIAQNNRNPRK